MANIPARTKKVSESIPLEHWYIYHATVKCNLRSNENMKSPATYLDSVVGFFVNNGHVAPTHSSNDFNHGLHLVMIRRNGPREKLEPLLVAQFRASREERHL
jgi:hypothetical protein